MLEGDEGDGGGGERPARPLEMPPAPSRPRRRPGRSVLLPTRPPPQVGRWATSDGNAYHSRSRAAECNRLHRHRPQPPRRRLDAPARPEPPRAPRGPLEGPPGPGRARGGAAARLRGGAAAPPPPRAGVGERGAGDAARDRRGDPGCGVETMLRDVWPPHRPRLRPRRGARPRPAPRGRVHARRQRDAQVDAPGGGRRAVVLGGGGRVRIGRTIRGVAPPVLTSVFWAPIRTPCSPRGGAHEGGERHRLSRSGEMKSVSAW